MGILSVNLNNINLDDTNYEEDDPGTVILIRLLAWHIKLEKYKISGELILLAWHPKRWWNFCVQKMKKKK